MKRPGLAPLAMLLALPTAVIAEEPKAPKAPTGKEFVAACQFFDITRHDELLQSCLNFTDAMAAASAAANAGTFAAYQSLGEMPKTPLTCIPQDAQSTTLLRIGIQFIIANPDAATRDSPALLGEAWDKAFPCKPGQKP